MEIVFTWESNGLKQRLVKGNNCVCLECYSDEHDWVEIEVEDDSTEPICNPLHKMCELVEDLVSDGWSN